MRILIGLIEHIGDVVACEPVSRYLRNKYPNAHLAWAIRGTYRELIDTNPHIDETITLECLTEWIKLCKHGGFDEIMDLHINLRICPDCGVPLIKERGNPFVSIYEWLDYGALLEAFSQGAGLPKLSAHPLVYLGDKHRKAVDALDLPPQYCVIHRVSNDPKKDWREEGWQTLVGFITKSLNLPVVEVGANKGDDSSPLGDSVINLINRTSLLETAEVVKRARFFIGVDSGPAHFANAVRTPGIVILGRLALFRQYTPFTGFYASNVPQVRIVRNPIGPANELSSEEVLEAIRYLARVLAGMDEQPASGPPPCDGIQPAKAKQKRKVVKSGLFDRAWYVTHYPEALQRSVDPLDYFVACGSMHGQAPGPGFDPAWYRSQRSDLAGVENPLGHYLDHGIREGLKPCPTVPDREPVPVRHTAMVLEALSEPARDIVPASCEKPPRLFAFYLPQFHPIAENNHGHRPGFTEWDNVIKAKPLFKGHYQPRIPGELGYYDLRSLDVMHEQIRLANDHGISGFCFYYYYFQGKKLLYKPIDNYIKSDIKAPFFFLWANENWTRRWDGGDCELIISQSHSTENDLLFIRELLPIFSDDRYVKIEGKPILMVYKSHLFPDIRRTTELWRDETEKWGFPGLYLVTVDDWTQDPPHPRQLGFDASYEIPSNVTWQQFMVDETKELGLKEGFEGSIVDYRKFASFHMSRPFPGYKRFRTVMAPWDNSPRYGLRAIIHVNTDNDAYKLWLSQAMLDTRRRFTPDEQIVFLHSWNEWCEGTYVEPDGRYGRRYLEETKEAVDQIREVIAFEQNGANLEVAAYLRRLARKKEEAAIRSLHALQQQNTYVHRELQSLKHEIEKLTAQNKAMRRSVSWFVTKPLRAKAFRPLARLFVKR